jgi:Holliday junction resolvasome RuvABC endonuclease subunit
MFVGVDYSITSPGMCFFFGDENDEFTLDKCKLYFLTPTKKYAGNFGKTISGTDYPIYGSEQERHDKISEWAMDLIRQHEIFEKNELHSIGIEGYAFGAKGKVFNLAENTGLLKYKVYKHGYLMQDIAPTEIKKRATGKGNANKIAMGDAFKELTGFDIYETITPDVQKGKGVCADMVDAFYVCKCTHENYKGVV